jgi:cytochrome oxidase assembly protein ShyY1
VLRPRWLAGHFLVLLFAAGFVALGFWQLGRHHEKQDKVRANRAAYAAAADELSASPAFDARVQALGTFDAAHEILLRNQVSSGGDTGYDVLTPLRLADGTAVLVNRGWNASTNPAPPPSGAVAARGFARRSRPPGSDTSEPINGRTTVARLDLARLGQGLPYPLRSDVWIDATALVPTPGPGAPELLQPPPPDRVNHMQYAIQWWLLALVPLIGWPIVLWRRGKRTTAQPAPPPQPVHHS